MKGSGQVHCALWVIFTQVSLLCECVTHLIVPGREGSFVSEATSTASAPSGIGGPELSPDVLRAPKMSCQELWRV